MPDQEKDQKTRLVTAGFLALDIVFGLDDLEPKFYAGGTCGNVTAGLAFLGWDVAPLGRLSDDAAGCFVRSDLERWGVSTEYLGLKPNAATPIVLERIERSKNGILKHRFLWNCPDCGSYFPPYRAVLRTQLPFVEEHCGKPEVFFTDRISRSTVDLARHFKAKGSIIYFEPSGTGDPKLFREMLKHCTVLKYSAQRARAFSDLLRNHAALLEIETSGEDGLRFRTRRGFPSWHSLPAHEVTIKDTAGSGDWTTVGLLSGLFRNGTPNLATATRHDIGAAIEHGQAIAALNCKFEGARGVMYKLTRTAFLEAVGTLEDKRPTPHREHKISLSQDISASLVCPSCRPKSLRDENECTKRRTAQLVSRS